MVPPEKLFFREASCSFESDSLNNIVVFMNSLDSAPEVEHFEVVFTLKFADSKIDINALF